MESLPRSGRKLNGEVFPLRSACSICALVSLLFCNALRSLLQRRAAVALEIAKSELADPASSLLLTAAAHQARDAQMQTRSQAESGLSGALGLLLNDGHLVDGFIEKDLLRELSELTDKIRVAIALHVDAVTRTQMVRQKPVFKIFRLAGTAPLPVTYEFETDVL